jgi:putative membrane protein
VQEEMRLLAAPMMMALGLLLCREHYRTSEAEAIRNHVKSNAKVLRDNTEWSVTHHRRKFLLWSLFVVIGSFLIELIGVKSGSIFGSYAYGEVLRPTLWNVPLAIGFAWLGMTISSASLAQRILSTHPSPSPQLMALVIALLMVIFDFFMEPAAMKLGYWSWHDKVVPWRNYAAWFTFGYIFSYIGLRLGLFLKKVSTLGVHAYVAQLLYFVMVNFS